MGHEEGNKNDTNKQNDPKSTSKKWFKKSKDSFFEFKKNWKCYKIEFHSFGKLGLKKQGFFKIAKHYDAHIKVSNYFFFNMNFKKNFI